MALRSNQTGFSVIEVGIVIAVVGLIGFVGYTAYTRFQDNKTATNQSSEQSAVADDVQSAPAINSTADLDQAQNVLDESDLENSSDTDASQLDSELAAF